MKKLLTTIVQGVTKTIVIAAALIIAFNLGSKAVIFYQYKDLIGALEQAKSATYSDKYQCLDFSKDLSQKLAAIGIGSTIEIVQTEKQNEYHAIVSLQIDPQTGEMVNYKTVDNCEVNGDTISCNKGSIENKNLYIASSK
ncbi:MAG: hypothetical protein Q8L11_04135 [Candidatus Moranbacteria bacterium]|nr:hypothetical protein [bacterium]MDP1834087.1 hypothetical protein [Candidatus Moranbacteria bacterium]